MLMLFINEMSNYIKSNLMKLYLHEIIMHVPEACVFYDFMSSSTENGERKIGILKKITKQFSNRHRKELTECLFSRENYSENIKNFHIKEKKTQENKKLENVWKN